MRRLNSTVQMCDYTVLFATIISAQAKGGLRMEQIEQTKKKLSTNEKIKILFGTLAGLGVGGVLGVIAYYQQWLG